MDILWSDYAADELSVHTLYELLALRNQVFIVEQACAYQDLDGADLLAGTRHVAGRSGGRLVACARLLAPTARRPQVRIGRVTVDPTLRGAGAGRRLMETALLVCARHWPRQGRMLSAQAHLQAFYGSFGFRPVGEVYDEDGIAHIDMQAQSPSF
ncbi:GNAT family N-acetyltransferase [Affinibrenneria salicis]|uniref:GNAT family N-acetyltransferase n=1 Tax=Affinibrenneria salicis TaxID=2590031 RepID=A0A5J5FVG7_9GAMM|nr:GNAT family N-acetyltransferase [Affinibrenneria salicis]KAA8997752.1 GNAT family N-acetyltransferase [Affinibrenneria salicis]